MTDPRNLVRMRDASGQITEVNSSNFGLLVPDDDGAVMVPAGCIDEMQRAGFILAPLSDAQKLANIAGAVEALHDCQARELLRRALLGLTTEHLAPA